MIKELHLTNWKSFGDGVLHVDALTILIGANASGKSNVLDALLFLQKMAQGKPIMDAVKGDQDSEGIRGGVDWVVKRGMDEACIAVRLESAHDSNVDYHYTVCIKLTPGPASRLELCSETLTKIKTNGKKSGNSSDKKLFHTGDATPEGPGLATYFYTAKQGKGKRLDLNRTFSVLAQSQPLPLLSEVHEGVTEVANQLKAIFVLDPIPSHIRGYVPLSDRLKTDASNVAGVLAALPPDEKIQVEGKITKYLRQLPEKDISKVWTETVGLFNNDAMLYCQEQWQAAGGPFTVDARSMSDGTLRFLSIITALLTLPQGSLLVVEEVDNGLHPSRAQLLVRLLKELGTGRGIDVVCTTHNPALLDALGNGMIPFISVVHREKVSGDSHIHLLEDLSVLPKLMAKASLGKMATSGLLEDALKEEV